MKRNSEGCGKTRLVYALLIVGVLVLGLVWRRLIFPNSPFLSKYGGDALWALLVFFALAFVQVRARLIHIAAAAIAFSYLVEFSQLYHTPWLDSLRRTRLGALVIGATFNWPDLIAYLVGIVMGVGVVWLFRRFFRE